MLAFPCTSCGQRLALAETWAGKKCRCSVCGQVLDVPLPGDAPLAAPASRSGEPSRTSGAARLAAPPTPRAQGNDRETIDRSAIDEQTSPPRAENSAGDDSSSSGPATIPETPEIERYDFLAPPEAADEIGRLGGYRIVKVLGNGGMGVVFQAEDIRLQRAAALKTMLPSLAASAANRRRFHLEAKAAAALEHDHIVTIYQVGEDRGVPFIAMQLLKGESLEQRLLRGSRFGVAELLRLGRAAWPSLMNAD
jgi:serine/threonine protein kinase